MAHSKKCFYKSGDRCCNSRALDKGSDCTNCTDKKTDAEVKTVIKVSKKGVVVA